MKNRSPVAVFFLSIITFGIYSIVWQVKTKNELNKLGASIPTAWLLIIPFVNIYWLWKYSEGVEKATNGTMSGVLAFVLLFLLGVIGMAILQNEYNKLGAGVPTVTPGSASAGPMPPTPTPPMPPDMTPPAGPMPPTA